MHTINLTGKTSNVDYDTTLGTTVLENIVITNGKKHSHNKVSSQSAIACSKLTIETLEQGVKYVQ